MKRNGISAPLVLAPGPRSGAGPEARTSRHSLAPECVGGRALPLQPSPRPGVSPPPRKALEGGNFSLADKRVLLHALERSTGFATVDQAVPDGQARWLILESRLRAEVE